MNAIHIFLENHISFKERTYLSTSTKLFFLIQLLMHIPQIHFNCIEEISTEAHLTSVLSTLERITSFNWKRKILLEKITHCREILLLMLLCLNCIASKFLPSKKRLLLFISNQGIEEILLFYWDLCQCHLANSKSIF